MKSFKDGSFRVKQQLPIVPQHYHQDPIDPLHYIPNFEPCIHRHRPEKRTPCGKTILGGNSCKLINQLITVGICQECNERVPP